MNEVYLIQENLIDILDYKKMSVFFQIKYLKENNNSLTIETTTKK